MCLFSFDKPLRPLRPPGMDPRRHHPHPHLHHHPRPYYPSFLSSKASSSSDSLVSNRRYVKIPPTHTFSEPVYRVAVPTISVPHIDIPVPQVYKERRIRGRHNETFLRGSGRHYSPPPVSPQRRPSNVKRVRFESPIVQPRPPAPPNSSVGGDDRIVDPPDVHVLPYPNKDYQYGPDHARNVRRATRTALSDASYEVRRPSERGLRRVKGRASLNGKRYPPFAPLGSWL